MKTPFVDLKPQYFELKSKIQENINNVLEHGRFILGPEVQELEEALSSFVGCKHTVTCSNGTIALSLALMALDIKPGDEVITTAYSFIATAETIALLGAQPVFVDIDPVTYNIDPDQVESLISEKTKALLPVSLYGQIAAMDELQKIAKKYNLPIIEDAAQSFGAEYKGKKSCNLSEIATTSFFPAKPLGGYGDGGAVFTNSDELAEKLRCLRNHGQTERYYHPYLGLNARLNSLQCAILLPKLERYPQEIEMRNKAAQYYSQKLEPLEKNAQFKRPTVLESNKSVWAQYTIEVDKRDELINHLKELGIPTAVHYPKTMAQQPAFSHFKKGSLEVAESKTSLVMSLPFYADITTEIQDTVCEGIFSFFN